MLAKTQENNNHVLLIVVENILKVSNLKYINSSEEAYSIKIKVQKYKKICIRMFIATLFIVTKSWKLEYILHLFKTLLIVNTYQFLREK